MTRVLQICELVEFEQWVKTEYPDIAWLFDELPKTLTDFVYERFAYLVLEFIRDKQWEVQE